MSRLSAKIKYLKEYKITNSDRISQILGATSRTKRLKSQTRSINAVQRTIPELDLVQHTQLQHCSRLRQQVTCVLYMHNLIYQTIGLSISIQHIDRNPTARAMPRKPGF